MLLAVTLGVVDGDGNATVMFPALPPAVHVNIPEVVVGSAHKTVRTDVGGRCCNMHGTPANEAFSWK